MARVTGLKFTQTRNEIEGVIRSQNYDLARRFFARQLLTDDGAKLRVPNVAGYTLLIKFRNEFSAHWNTQGNNQKRR